MLSKGFVLAALLGWKEARDHPGWGGWFVAGLFGIFFPSSLTRDTNRKYFCSGSVRGCCV